MGKKTGATQRLKKRVDAITSELIHEQLEQNEKEMLQNKPDSELFVVETTVAGASSSTSTLVSAARAAETYNNKIKKRKPSLSTSLSDKKPKREDKRHRISELDQRRIRKLKSAHPTITTATTTAAAPTTISKFKGGQVPANFNLWDDQEYIRFGCNTGTVTFKDIPMPTGQAAAAGTAPVIIQSVPTSRLRKDIQQPSTCGKVTSTSSLPTALQRHKPQRTVVKVDVAQPGQSYRPDKEQHQDVIGEALAIELRRRDRLEYNKTPLGHDSKSRLALYNSKDDDDDNSEDSDEEDNSDVDVESNNALEVGKKRKKEKLTKTQRNKQKRARQEKQKLQQRKREKQFIASLEDAKKFTKEIKKLELKHQSHRDELKKLKQLDETKPIGIHVFQDACQRNPIHAPSLPVALTEELVQQGNGGGSLRLLKTKGSLITDRLESFISRNMLSATIMERKMIVQGKKKRMKKSTVSKDEFLLS